MLFSKSDMGILMSILNMQAIDYKETEKSAKAAIVSKMEAIISKEDINIDSKIEPVKIMMSHYDMNKTIDKLSKPDAIHNQTIVFLTTKKAARKQSFIKTPVVAELTFRSNFYFIFDCLNKSWVELNDDDSDDTNVCFIPDIQVSQPFNFQTTLKKSAFKPEKINVLILALPSVYDISTSIEKCDTTDIYYYVIDNILQASIKCGAKNLIIDPLDSKYADVDAHLASLIWSNFISAEKVMENINQITFNVVDDVNNIIFKKTLNKFTVCDNIL